MNRRSLALALAGVVLIAAGVGVVAATSDDASYNTSESELLNASRTNMPVSGSGDDAVVEYAKPDVSESTNAEFSNGSLSGPVTVANDAVEYGGLVLGSQHTTDTEFQNAQALENVSVEGSGESADVVLETAGIVDSFEDGDIAEYSDDTASFEVNSSAPVFDGTQSLKTTSNTVVHIFSTSGLNTYPEPGDTTYFEYQTTDGGAVHSGFDFGVQNSSAYYEVKVDGGNSELRLRKIDGGSTTVLDNASAAWPSNERTQFEIDWQSDGTITVTAFDSSGSTLGQVTAADTEYGGGGIGWMGGAYSGNPEQVFDYARNTSAGESVGTYISQNHSVSNAAEAAINISDVVNATATLQVEYADGSNWVVANKTTVSSAGNHTLQLADTSADTWRVNVTFEQTDSDLSARLSDESIMSTKKGTYTTQTYNISEVSGATLDASLPNSTVTIDWEASADGSTWVTQETTSYSSTGTHTASFSGDYQYWRAAVSFTYDGGDGSGAWNSLTWDAATAGTYQGQTHEIANASHAFLALTNKDATTEVTVEGYDNSTDTWEESGNKTYTSSVFSSFSLNGSYSKYRTNLSVTSTGSPTVELHSEGVTAGGTTVVEETTTTGEEITLTTAISEPKAASNSLISDLPLDLLPTYLGADISATIKSWFASVFGGGASEANAEEEASQLQSTYNDNANDYTSWVNSQTADQDLNLSAYDTVKVTFSVNGENATRYVIGLVDNDRFATTTVVNETNRTVDETLVLKGQAAVDADTTLDTIHKEFVLGDKPISRKYQTRLSARYGSQFGGTLLNASA